MPVQINEIDAQVEVVGDGAQPESAARPDCATMLEQWRELQRRQEELAARTAAFEFDD